MRVPLGAAGAERDPQLGARQMPRQPGQVGVGQWEAVLARAFPDDQLRRRGRPRTARVARLVGDEHHLEPTPLGLGGDLAEAKRLLGGAGKRDDAVDFVEHHGEVLGIEVARDQHGGVLARGLVGCGQCAREGQRPVENLDRSRARRPRRRDQPGDRATERRAGADPDLLSALIRRAPSTRAEHGGAPAAGSEQPLALGVDHVDQDLRDLTREVDQRVGLELERGGDRARDDGRGSLSAGDRILRADHVALSHPQLDLAAPDSRAGRPADQSARDHPDPVALRARLAQLLARLEAPLVHAAGDDVELAVVESREQRASAQGGVVRHQARAPVIDAAYGGRGAGVKNSAPRPGRRG